MTPLKCSLSPVILFAGLSLVGLSLVSLSLAGLPSSTASAENPTSTPVNPAEFTSYLDYQLRPAHFQPSFHEVIEKINAALSPSPQAPALKTILSNLAAREKTESRGRVDIVYFLEGYIFEKLGKKKEALAAYGKAVAERSQVPLYVFRHAFLLKSQGRCEQASTEFQQLAWAVKRASAEPLFLAGECLEQLGKKDEAKRLYAESLKRDSHFVPVLRKTLQEANETITTEYDPKKKAELEIQMKSLLENILTQIPNDREASLQLSEMLLKGPKSVLSNSTYTRVIQLSEPIVNASNSKDPKSVLLLFEAQKRLGKLEEARKTLTAGLEKNPDSLELQQAQRGLELEQGLQEQETSDR